MFWIVLTSNEFGSSPLEDAKIHIAIESAFIEFSEKVNSGEHVVVTLYEFNPEKLEFNKVNRYILDDF